MLKYRCFILIISLFIFIGCLINTTHKETDQINNIEKPIWVEETIIEEENFIYSIGHSRYRKSEKEAKEEAIVAATENFTRYCGVTIQVFDRCIEIYSKQNSGEYYSADLEAKSFIRANAFIRRAIPDEWFIYRKDGEFIASVLLRIPRDEFERIINEKDIKIALDFLLYYEDANGQMQILSDGSVLKSGSGYAIYLNSSDLCYLYVYQIDSMSKSYRLFPNAVFNTRNNPIPPGDNIWIPNDEQLFVLDETTGKERIYLFASLDPIDFLENEVELNKKDLDTYIEVKKMGVATIREKRDKESVASPGMKLEIVDVKKKLQAEGAFVYETWFWHK